jgi:hypothetical protein
MLGTQYCSISNEDKVFPPNNIYYYLHQCRSKEYKEHGDEDE